MAALLVTGLLRQIDSDFAGLHQRRGHLLDFFAFCESHHGDVLCMQSHVAHLDAVVASALSAERSAPSRTAATQRWMGWTISRVTRQRHGIPKGLPCLTGFVIHCEIVEDALAE